MCELCMRNMQVSENFERFATFSRASSVFNSFFYFLRPFDDKILQGDILINIYTFKGSTERLQEHLNRTIWQFKDRDCEILVSQVRPNIIGSSGWEKSLKNQNGLLVKSNALSQHSQLQTSIFSYATAWFRTMCRRWIGWLLARWVCTVGR